MHEGRAVGVETGGVDQVPDLDPALVQAAALAPHLHTPDLAAAVAQRDALRTSLRTAHTIDSRLADIAARNRDQGNDGRTRQ